MAKPPAAKKKRISLSIELESGQDVFVAGSFNEWTLSDNRNKKMRKLKEDKEHQGLYSINMFLLPGSYEYKFFCDNQWYLDPKAENKLLNPFGGFNSVLDVT